MVLSVRNLCHVTINTSNKFDRENGYGSTMSKAYWDSVAATKVFTHPLPSDWLAQHVKQDASILDVGCGYGRSCSELLSLGYRNVSGVDISSAMIARAEKEVPGATFFTMTEGQLPVESGSVDAVLLMAVLTCIPRDEDQFQLVSEIKRVLRPDGILLLSTYPLQGDERNRQRYETFAEPCGRYGVFEVDEGRTIVRHLDLKWLNELFERFGFTLLEEKELAVKTMNGNEASILQRCMVFR